MKTPVFDIGDTLIPSHEYQNRKAGKILKEKGVNSPPKLDINEYNIHVEEEIEEWLRENGINAKASEIKKRYHKWQKKFLEENVLDELKKISDEFGPVGFISDNSLEAKEFYRKIFEDSGIDFQGFVVSGEVGVEKPDPEIFREFLDRRDETAEEFVYFGNYVDRDKASEKVGMDFVWVDGFHVFGSSYSGTTIHTVDRKSVEKALREVEKG